MLAQENFHLYAGLRGFVCLFGDGAPRMGRWWKGNPRALSRLLKYTVQQKGASLKFRLLLYLCFGAFGRPCLRPCPRPNATTYIAAIRACAKGGQWQEALAMLTAKVQPNVISAAISACERGGQGLAVLMLFEAVPQNPGQPDVISCNAASSACERVGQWQPAFTLFEAMPRAKVQPNAIAYSAAIKH